MADHTPRVATQAVPLDVVPKVPEVVLLKLSVTTTTATTELDVADAADVPLAFTAVTEYVYVPLTVSLTTTGLADPDAVTPEVEVTT